jgi:hypothetical protein
MTDGSGNVNVNVNVYGVTDGGRGAVAHGAEGVRPALLESAAVRTCSWD